MYVAWGQVGYFSNDRRFSVESSLQGISSNSLSWKRNDLLKVIQTWSWCGKHPASTPAYLRESNTSVRACLREANDHVRITINRQFRFHNNQLDEMPCKLDSAENPRSSEPEKYGEIPTGNPALRSDDDDCFYYFQQWFVTIDWGSM